MGEKSEKSSDKGGSDKGGSDKGANYVLIGLVAVVAIGFFVGQWISLSALTGRLDTLERNIMEQCGRCDCEAAQVNAAAQAAAKTSADKPPEEAPAPSATESASAAPTASASASASAAPAAPAPAKPASGP